MRPTHELRNISEIRTFYRTNDEPIYFVGPTPFNLLGLDRWVRNFNYVTYYDPWDGEHPRIITPAKVPDTTFTSSEQITNHLLTSDEVRTKLAARGGVPRVMAVFIDEETEAICADLGYQLTLPPVALRKRLDSKLETTRLGNEAGAPSVPNTLAAADSYEQLLRLAADAGLLGLLVQENVFQDVAAGRLRWLPLADAEAQSATGLYQRLGQRAAVATGVFVQFLDRAFNEWVSLQ